MNIIAWFNILIAGIIAGFLSAFILSVLTKWGVFDFYLARRRPWMPKRICFFCLGFWFSVVFVVAYIATMPTGSSFIHTAIHAVLIPAIGCVVAFNLKTP